MEYFNPESDVQDPVYDRESFPFAFYWECMRKDMKKSVWNDDFEQLLIAGWWSKCGISGEHPATAGCIIIQARRLNRQGRPSPKFITYTIVQKLAHNKLQFS